MRALLKSFVRRWHEYRFKLAVRWVEAAGLSIVDIKEVDGTAYILCDDGSRMRIGREKRK